MSTTSLQVSTSPTQVRQRTLARFSLLSAVGFVGSLLLAGLLDPGYSHLSEAISALASVESEAAPVMIFGFLCLGVTAIAAGLALWSSLRSRSGRIASALVVVAGLLTVLAGFARQSCSTLQQSCLDRESAGTVSGAHVLHNLSALLLFVLLVVAGFLLAVAARRDPRLRSLARPALVAAGLSLLFMVWFGSAAYGDLGGLVQRVLVLLAYGLPVAIALRVTRPTSDTNLEAA